MSTIAPQFQPGRTPQRMRALRQANDARTAAANVKQHLATLTQREARLEVARLLVEDVDQIGIVKVYSLLMAIPRIGDAKVRQLLNARNGNWYIWPFSRVDELTDRQRNRIAGELVVLASKARR